MVNINDKQVLNKLKYTIPVGLVGQNLLSIQTEIYKTEIHTQARVDSCVLVMSNDVIMAVYSKSTVLHTKKTQAFTTTTHFLF